MVTPALPPPKTEMRHPTPSPSTQPLAPMLAPFKVEKGHDHTHTSLARPAGSYYLPASSHDAFLAAYKAALDRGEDLHMTERHRHISPVLVDLDFRYEPSPEKVAGRPPQRRHAQVVDAVVQAYCRALAQLVEVPTPSFEVYVTEKLGGPTMFKGLVKDGLHIVVPGVVTQPAVQLLLRTELLPDLGRLMHPLQLANRVEDVVDEAVIHRNNWMMYGSHKPNSEAYVVTRRYSYAVSDGGGLQHHDVDTLAAVPASTFVELFSIRNKYDECVVREDQRERVDAFVARQEEEQRRRDAMRRVLVEQPNQRQNTCDDLDFVVKLVGLLGDHRVDCYNDWVRLGWCLRNIDHRLLEAWVEISKRSSKYVEGECPRLWQSMRVAGLGMGTLHMWARDDSPEGYRELLRIDLGRLIRASVGGAHYDVAKVVHHMYRYEYVCCSIRTRRWYEFRSHRWRECESAVSLRQRLSTCVFKEYMKVKQQLTQRAMVSDDEAEQKDLLQQSKKMADLALNLKMTKFKDNVLTECGELFHHDNFESLLDSDVSLLGFENGVYDLQQHEFHEGRPEDYVSFSTGINYVPYMENSPTVREIMRFWESVQPCREIREYVLLTLASCLSGVIREERFHIWTGSGCHAAGTRVLLRTGDTLAVEDVMPGDVLVGDDGSPRRVLQLFRGHGVMYRVCSDGGDCFVVNADHVLSLRVWGATPSAQHLPGTRSVLVRWLEEGADASASASASAVPWRERTRIVDGEAEALALMKELKEEEVTLLDGDTVDVTVRTYLSSPLPATSPVRFTLFRCPLPRYQSDDNDDGKGVQAREAAFRAGVQAWAGKGTDEVPPGVWNGAYEVRRALLAGLTASAATRAQMPLMPVPPATRPFSAAAVVQLARSLGLACEERPPRLLDFSANPPVFLDAMLNWRFDPPPLPSPDAAPWLCRPFQIQPLGADAFFGFEVSGNLLADLTATHNSNGKSLSVSLFEKAMGQYCCKFPVTLLTQKRAASNTATPEIARAKGRRFAVLQEPSEDERLNVGQLKELSGGDTVQTRELFKPPCEWRPQFKLFLLCNQLPHVPSDDGGTWRRIRVVEFASKFVENPNPERANEFPIDMELGGKLDGWKEAFMAILLQYYQRYVNNRLVEPDAVVNCTRDYQRTNDHIADFVDTCIERTDAPTAVMSLDDAFSEFKEWVRQDNIPMKVPKKTLLQRYLDRSLVRGTSVKGRVTYRGFALRDRFAAAERDGDDGELDS